MFSLGVVALALLPLLAKADPVVCFFSKKTLFLRLDSEWLIGIRK